MKRQLHWMVLALVLMGLISQGWAQESRAPLSSWRKHVVNDQSPYEAAGVADFNGDGQVDIFCGDSWYAAPDWKRHKVREVLPGTNPHYHEDFADLPMDVNGDGKIDIVTCAYFSKRVGWVEQPSDPTKPWTEHTVDHPGPMETGYLVDLNNDGKPDFLPNIASSVGWYELTSQKPEVVWKKHELGKDGRGHGVGSGDINRDGRIDIITPRGWYEQPAKADGDWVFHAEFELGSASVPVVGHDFDGDGDTDIVWGMGHDFGLFWLRNTPGELGNTLGKRTESMRVSLRSIPSCLRTSMAIPIQRSLLENESMHTRWSQGQPTHLVSTPFISIAKKILGSKRRSTKGTLQPMHRRKRPSERRSRISSKGALEQDF